MTTPVLQFSDVAMTYAPPGSAGRRVLDGVSFDLPRGRSMALVGRSGSGKSTLLHLAAGIATASQGQVLLEGRDLGRTPEGERAQLRRSTVGLVFQFFHLLPHLDVRDNVLLPAMIAGDSVRDQAPRALDLLRRVGLADRAAETVQKLSGGEMQRVAICRALLRRPTLLLADEPTGNLDDENGRRVMDLLLELVEAEGSTLIYVTHSRRLAGAADFVQRLHDGRLEADADS
jgi:putative ABC transport system ATP-binding protein